MASEKIFEWLSFPDDFSQTVLEIGMKYAFLPKKITELFLHSMCVYCLVFVQNMVYIGVLFF